MSKREEEESELDQAQKNQNNLRKAGNDREMTAQTENLKKAQTADDSKGNEDPA